MKSKPPLTVNLISGLVGSGKSSTSRASGAIAVGLVAVDPDAIATAISSRPHHGEVMLEVHPSTGPLEAAIAVLTTGSDQTTPIPPRPVRLGNVVSVLDASRFWSDLESDALAPLPPVHCAAHGTHDRTVAEALVEQIEWASVVVINKTDLAGPGHCADLFDFVRLLNPASHVVFARHGRSAVSPWLPPRDDMLAFLQNSPGWIRQLNGAGLLASSPSGLRCAVYRDPRPFHPGRLAGFLARDSADAGEILRSRGLFRLASRPFVVGSWSSAGPSVVFEPTSMGSHDPESPWGQEIAFFGRHLDTARLTRNLDACLLSDHEFISGPMCWASLADPFPEWDLGHGFGL